MQVIGVTLKSDEKELTDKKLLKCVMQRWIPAAEALLEMVRPHPPVTLLRLLATH
jgi:elongation factor 2